VLEGTLEAMASLAQKVASLAWQMVSHRLQRGEHEGGGGGRACGTHPAAEAVLQRHARSVLAMLQTLIANMTRPGSRAGGASSGPCC